MRFKRLRDGRPRRRLLMGVRPLPTLVTLGNLLCGFGAIVLAMRAHNPPPGLGPADCLTWAGLLVFLAMIFDVLDGRVARWTKSTSQFGMELDSLCDVVSFGVAPAVLVKAALDQATPRFWPNGYPVLDRFVWLMLATYVSCAALRLARYNVESATVHRDFFFGLPSPAAAGCVASLVILVAPAVGGHHPMPRLDLPRPFQEQISYLDLWRSDETLATWIFRALPVVMLCIGVLMVSRVHYLHVGDRLLRGRHSLIHLLVLVLSLVLIVVQHEVMLALCFNGYVLLGLVNELRYQLFPGQRPAEWISSADEVAAAPAAPPGGGVQGAMPAAEAPAPPPASPRSGA